MDIAVHIVPVAGNLDILVDILGDAEGEDHSLEGGEDIHSQEDIVAGIAHRLQVVAVPQAGLDEDRHSEDHNQKSVVVVEIRAADAVVDNDAEGVVAPGSCLVAFVVVVVVVAAVVVMATVVVVVLWMLAAKLVGPAHLFAAAVDVNFAREGDYFAVAVVRRSVLAMLMLVVRLTCFRCYCLRNRLVEK